MLEMLKLRDPYHTHIILYDGGMDSPIGKGILDVVAGGVDEHAMLIPTSTLQPHILVYSAQALELAVADAQSYKNTHQ